MKESVMIQKNFDDITKADIDFLVSNEIGEKKTLEYKQNLPSGTEKDKHEFLADISSFANSSGGDIIYGIKEKVIAGKKTGQAEKVMPLKDTTANDAQLRLENMIRTGIEPRLPIQIKPIDGYDQSGKGFVILVRIPQSFASPHMIKSSSRFYCRNSAGKYQLDVQEIRNAFFATDSQAERIRNFLKDRLAKIIADETPLKLSEQNRLVLHILPLNFFLNKKRVNFGKEYEMKLNLIPIGVSGWDSRYNLDGLVTFQADRETNLCRSYCQIFLNGTIEAVYAGILNTKHRETTEESSTTSIPSIAYESYIVSAVQNYFSTYKILEIGAPVVISMALLGCKGAYMGIADYLDSYPIDRDIVVLPEITAESLDEKLPTIMKPIFDAVWNACGFARSYNYTENGIWNVRKFR